jgi:predicted O-methyltransferase YrrM
VYSRFRVLQKYLYYLLTASNGKGHGIHSPFVYHFIAGILNDKRKYPAYTVVEGLRKKLLKDETVIPVNDYGAGSAVSNSKTRRIGAIAQHAAKQKKYAQLLFRISQAYQPSTIVELGTSLGISTAYLAMANKSAKLFTLEGAPSIGAKAENNFRQLGLTNITVVNGRFDDILSGILEQVEHVDLAFVDGNHRKAPTLEYYNQLLAKARPGSLFIFDDIHWSAEMEVAWAAIKQHHATMLTIDLFFIGLVFFREEFKIKQHFTIRF